MKPIQDIYPMLAQPRNIVITMHQKPDADAMGSALGLRHFLDQLGHTVTVVSPTNWASWLNWMPGSKEVLDYNMIKEKAEGTLKKADWIFCLDFNAFYRTKTMTGILESLQCPKILIDHHQQPDLNAFEYGVSDSSKIATCEMVYDLIVESGYSEKINKEISECIYAGVVADTGSFRFSSASSNVHILVADLMKRGLEHTRVHDGLFDNYLENRLRFIGHVLLNRMEVFYEYNTVLIAIPKSDLLKYHIKTGDTEGLVNFPQSIQGIKLVAMVIDRDEERKWSFRSKGDFDCNTFARNYFEGGGHKNASGGRSSETVEAAIEKFKNVIKINIELLQ